MADSEAQTDKLNHDSLIDAVLKHEPYHEDVTATTSDLGKFIIKNYRHDSASIGVPLTLELLEQCISMCEMHGIDNDILKRLTE